MVLIRIITWLTCIFLFVACWNISGLWFIGMIGCAAALMIFPSFKRYTKNYRPLSIICGILIWPLYLPIFVATFIVNRDYKRTVPRRTEQSFDFFSLR